MVRIPNEYQEVEWIEGKIGYARIDTGVKGNDNAFVISGKVRPLSFSQYMSFFGNYIKENSNVTRLIYNNNNDGFIIANVNRQAKNSVGINAKFYVGQDHTFVLSKNAIVVDGINYTYQGSAQGTANETNIALNASRVDATPSGSNYSRWYYFKIQSGETPLRDFVPCYRKSDNKGGMYDLVGKSFYPSIGTEEFTIGNDVSWETIDLLALRRMIIMGGMNNMGIWKQKTITAEYNITNGESLKTWLENLVPSGANAYLICRDNLDVSTYTNNQFICATYFGNFSPGAIRYRNDYYVQTTSGNYTSAYDFRVNQGEKYTIFYQ